MLEAPTDGRRGRVCLRRLAALLACLVLGCIGGPERPAPPRVESLPPASLSGRLVVEGERLSAADLARAVVYLEPTQAQPPASAPADSELHHRSARLSPDLLAVAPGDAVWLVNDDRIFHGAFSYSRPNAFDLGAYGPGERRRIQLAHAGAVRIQCPFHPDESGVVFVTPTRLVARPASSGAYQIGGVAPGRYWLKVWIDGLPELAYDVTLRPGEAAFRELRWRAREPASGAADVAPAQRAP